MGTPLSIGALAMRSGVNVETIRYYERIGVMLDKLRGLLRLVDGDAYTCAKVRALTIAHLEDIRRKIADGVVNFYTGHVGHCSFM